MSKARFISSAQLRLPPGREGSRVVTVSAAPGSTERGSGLSNSAHRRRAVLTTLARARVRYEHAVIDEEVGARPRDERCEAADELQWIEQEVRRAVRPRGAQFDADRAVVEKLQPILCDGRAQKIATKPFSTLPVACGDGHRGVEVEACDVRVHRLARREPRRPRVEADAPHQRAGIAAVARSSQTPSSPARASAS